MKINIFSNEWCDIVFENKNKAYGAYKLRKSENRKTAIAIIVGAAIFLSIFSFPFIEKALSSKAKVKNVDVIKLTDIKFEEKKIETKVIEESVPLKKMQKTFKFIPPVITNNGEETDIPINDIIDKNKDKISNIDNPDGIKDPDAEIPINKVEEITNTPKVEAPEIWVDQLPEFVGGQEEMYNFIKNRIQYPQMARETGITGKVMLKFVIDKNGNITDIEVYRGIEGGCNEEAIRVLKLMPKWNPGKLNGKSVAYRVTLPIVFSLK